MCSKYTCQYATCAHVRVLCFFFLRLALKNVCFTEQKDIIFTESVCTPYNRPEIIQFISFQCSAHRRGSFPSSNFCCWKGWWFLVGSPNVQSHTAPGCRCCCYTVCQPMCHPIVGNVSAKIKQTAVQLSLGQAGIETITYIVHIRTNPSRVMTRTAHPYRAQTIYFGIMRNGNRARQANAKHAKRYGTLIGHVSAMATVRLAGMSIGWGIFKY